MCIGFFLYACLCDDIGSPETEVTYSLELLCACWELNSGHLEEQSVIFTTGPLDFLSNSIVAGKCRFSQKSNEKGAI